MAFHFPVGWKDIDRFERNNDISVNVLGLVGKDIVTLRKTKEKKERHVILFKLQTSKTSHFALGATKEMQNFIFKFLND